MSKEILSEVVENFERRILGLDEPVEITQENALGEMNAWLAGFMQPHENEGKLMLCGSGFYGIVTGCYDPRYWPKLRGNSAQRRIKRRYLQRMWDGTKDAVASIRERWAAEGHPIDTPSRILGTW